MSLPVDGNVMIKELKEYIKQQSDEVKKEIKIFRDEISNKIIEVEEKYIELEKKIVSIERSARRNNIVIFGIKTEKTNIEKSTLDELNRILDLNIKESDLNNIYTKGKKM